MLKILGAFIAFFLGILIAIYFRAESSSARAFVAEQAIGVVIQAAFGFGYFYYARKTYLLRKILAKHGISEKGND